MEQGRRGPSWTKLALILLRRYASSDAVSHRTSSHSQYGKLTRL